MIRGHTVRNAEYYRVQNGWNKQGGGGVQNYFAGNYGGGIMDAKMNAWRLYE